MNEWKQEEKRFFAGWDFSYLAEKRIEDNPPWSYERLVRELLTTATSVLDLGTGGGEKLLEFKDVLPRRTVVTEGYPPNVQLAKERLEPLGIEVVESKDVGALVYYLKAVPWVVGGFSVDHHVSYLERQQIRLEQEGQLTFHQKLFVLKAKKANSR